jgi:hypothetical protein
LASYTCHTQFVKTATATECLICTQRGERVAGNNTFMVFNTFAKNN